MNKITDECVKCLEDKGYKVWKYNGLWCVSTLPVDRTEIDKPVLVNVQDPVLLAFMEQTGCLKPAPVDNHQQREALAAQFLAARMASGKMSLSLTAGVLDRSSMCHGAFDWASMFLEVAKERRKKK